MKILLYGINFSPELTGIGKYTGEMAVWLAHRGHDVRVVSGFPYYPSWRIDRRYTGAWYVSEAHGAVQVLRCPLWVPLRPGGVKRLVHLASFAISSFPMILGQLSWRPNIVWVVAPAFFCVPSALFAAKLIGARSWLHVQDYEVDAAFDLGMLKGIWLKRFALWLERRLLLGFDRFSTISQRMFQLGLAKGVDKSKAVLFPNWVDLGGISAANSTLLGGYRYELGIPEGALIALYSGNMGAKQGLEILSQAAARLAEVKTLYFVFCGNGAGRADLELQCRGFSNVRFLDLQPSERLGELLRTADIHLLPQRADAADLVMPSKLTGMLASGRCVVATAHTGTEVAMVVEGKGLVVPPEDAAAFSDAILLLSKDQALRDEFGRNGCLYAEMHLDKDSVLLAFEAELERLVKSS